MSHEEIKQRIKYLVEHGGLYDDPIEDVRRAVKVGVGIAAAALVLLVMEVALRWLN